MAEPDQPGFPAQPKHLLEQPPQRRQMTLAEIGDRPEVRPLQPGHCHEIDPLLAGPRELTRRINAAAIAVQQQRDHHRRMVRRLPALFGVRAQYLAQIQCLAHRLPNEMRRMIRRHELMDRRRQKPTLIHMPGAKALAHEPRESRPYSAVQQNTRTAS